MQAQYETSPEETFFQKKRKWSFLLAVLLLYILLDHQKGVSFELLRSTDLSSWIFILAPVAAFIVLTLLLRKTQWDIAGKSAHIPMLEQKAKLTDNPVLPDLNSHEKKIIPIITFFLIIFVLLIFFLMNSGPDHSFSISMWKNILTQLSVTLPGVVFLLIVYFFSIFQDKNKSTEELQQEDLKLAEQVKKNAEIMPFTGISIWSYILWLIIITAFGVFGIDNLTSNQNHFWGGLSIFIMALLLYGSSVYKKS